ncbi:MAG: MurR/RpiR family transcriptional regulator [Eubacteriaceae bacterium]
MKIEERYNQFNRNLNENDLIIWKYIKGNKGLCCELSISELAKRCNVSRTTILRFAKKLDFSGFSEMKITLRQELNALPKENISNMGKVVSMYNDAIRRTREKNCHQIFSLIDSSKKIYVYSSGMLQSTVAREMTRVFLSAKKLFFEINGVAETNQILQTITPNDLIFIVSYSGESPETVQFAKALKIQNIPIVSITTLQENELAKLSNFNLYTSSLIIEKDVFDITYTSVTTFFILIEMLFMKYIEYQREKGEEHESKPAR